MEHQQPILGLIACLIIIAVPVCLKAFHVISCSWWVALIPLWVLLGIACVPLLFIVVVWAIVSICKKKTQQES